MLQVSQSVMTDVPILTVQLTGNTPTQKSWTRNIVKIEGVRGESWHHLVTHAILQSLPGCPFFSSPSLGASLGAPPFFPVLYSSWKPLEGSDPSGPKLKLEILLSTSQHQHPQLRVT